MIVAVLFLALGAAAIAYGFLLLVAGDKGWREIEGASGEVSAAGDFVLLYNVGAGAVSAGTENRALSSLYKQTARKAYQLFTSDEGFEGLNNVYSLNARPNEEQVVDAALYAAFEQLSAYKSRALYLGAIYEFYDDIFLTTDDAYAQEFDPRRSSETAEYYSRIAAFANDPASIELELLGEGRVRLQVSAEYLAFAQENGITKLIDFTWMKNAFIADYLAGEIASQGYTLGCLSSYDGYTRSLSENESYALNIYDRGTIAAVMEYREPTATVTLRSYPMNGMDARRFYEYRNGEGRTPYMGADGLDHAAIADLMVYSRTKGCAEILLSILPLYVSERFDSARLGELPSAGLYSVWCEEDRLCYTEPDILFTELHDAYTAAYVPER